MNSKILLLLVTIVIATILPSCSNEEITGPVSLSTQTITAELAEPYEAQQSRTCVDVNNPSTSFIGLLWQPNDTVGVYSADGNSGNYAFTCNAAVDVPQAEFTGEMSGTPYYAYYPYSAVNNGMPVTALKGTLLAEQPFDPESGTLVCDYKYGTRSAEGNNKFKFQQLFTMLRLNIDASGTTLEGEHLSKIVLSVTSADGNLRPICGDFTFSAVDGTWEAGSNTSNSISMPWTTGPALTSGTSYLGFISLMPVVKAGDVINIEVITEGHKASFKAECMTDLQQGYVYDIPLQLSLYANNSDKFNYEEKAIPVITSFGFEVTNNEGKLLDNKLVWNSSSHTPSFEGVTSYSATVDNVKGEITLTIPYLYDFKLIPTYTVSSNSALFVNDIEQESGVTEVDFTEPVVFTVSNTDGESRDYKVKIVNSGLPVVVVNQSTTGDFSEVKSGGFLGIGAKTLNKFVDFMIRGKDTEWVEDDKFTVYNADGTIDCQDVPCGVRLRGNTSQDYPKKPFAIKLTGKTQVLGMPEHKRWILLANWLDHSMIRNAVAFDVAHAIENAWRNSNGAIGDGIPWNVHGKNVELVFIENGEAHHVGNYYLCEHIKINKNRLDIKDPQADADIPTDNIADYGYLLEVDNNYDEVSQFKTENGVPFMFKDEVSNALKAAVQAKIKGIEDNIDNGNFAAAYEDLDINSVIDQWLIWELTMNREYGDPRSVYMFMDGDGKLCAGPVWDFDRGTFQYYEGAKALGNTEGYRLKPYDAWMCDRTQETDSYSYIWYRQLKKDATFKAAVKERWAVIKPYLDLIPNQIRSYGESLAVSYEYDSAMWPTNKEDIHEYKSDFNDWSGDEEIADFKALIETFVTSYQSRLNGIDRLIDNF